MTVVLQRTLSSERGGRFVFTAEIPPDGERPDADKLPLTQQECETLRSIAHMLAQAIAATTESMAAQVALIGLTKSVNALAQRLGSYSADKSSSTRAKEIRENAHDVQQQIKMTKEATSSNPLLQQTLIVGLERLKKIAPPPNKNGNRVVRFVALRGGKSILPTAKLKTAIGRKTAPSLKQANIKVAADTRSSPLVGGKPVVKRAASPVLMAAHKAAVLQNTKALRNTNQLSRPPAQLARISVRTSPAMRQRDGIALQFREGARLVQVRMPSLARQALPSMMTRLAATQAKDAGKSKPVHTVAQSSLKAEATVSKRERVTPPDIKTVVLPVQEKTSPTDRLMDRAKVLPSAAPVSSADSKVPATTRAAIAFPVPDEKEKTVVVFPFRQAAIQAGTKPSSEVRPNPTAQPTQTSVPQSEPKTSVPTETKQSVVADSKGSGMEILAPTGQEPKAKNIKGGQAPVIADTPDEPSTPSSVVIGATKEQKLDVPKDKEPSETRGEQQPIVSSPSDQVVSMPDFIGKPDEAPRDAISTVEEMSKLFSDSEHREVSLKGVGGHEDIFSIGGVKEVSIQKVVDCDDLFSNSPLSDNPSTEGGNPTVRPGPLPDGRLCEDCPKP